jgi:hypothetical protein
MQIYTQEHVQEIEAGINTIRQRYRGLQLKILDLAEKLKKEEAKKYLMHGVWRRLGITKQCIENVFLIFPAYRKKILDKEELTNIDINLHAFLVNIFGLLDNLAWVSVHEKELAGVIDRNKVGVFKKETKEHFPSAFREYLDSGRIKNWHNQYLKKYRDALSHRLPLYVPAKAVDAEQAMQISKINDDIAEIKNSIVNNFKSHNLDGIAQFDAIDKLCIEENNIGSAYPVFTQTDEKGGMVLHAQLIADFNTVEEIVEKYCGYL